jgi:hypothetical protein
MEVNYELLKDKIRLKTMNNKDIIMSLNDIISIGTSENPRKLLFILFYPLIGLFIGLIMGFISGYITILFIVISIYSIYYGQKKIPQKVLRIESSGGISYLVLIKNSNIFEEIEKIQNIKLSI